MVQLYQELIVLSITFNIEPLVHYGNSMTSQTDLVKQDFAQRLHKAMDVASYPIRGRARILSREFNVSDKGAGKWLNGDAMPETSKIPLIAQFLKVNAEWLLSGSGAMLLDSENKLLSENPIRNFKPTYNLKELGDFIEELEVLDKNKGITLEALLLLRQTLRLITKPS